MTNIPPFDLAFRSQITDLKRREKYALKELRTRVLKAILEKEPGRLSTNINFPNRPSTVDHLLAPLWGSKKADHRYLISAAEYKKRNLAFDGGAIRILAENQLQGLKQNTLTRIRNRCVLSGRSSTLRKFRLSRIAFRELAGSGKLQGVTKRLQK